MRETAALIAAGAVAALVGGVLYKVAAGGTTTSRSVATGFWIAAAVCLVLMAVSGQKLFWRRAGRPLPEGRVFVTAAIALTVIGAVVDSV